MTDRAHGLNTVDNREARGADGGALARALLARDPQAAREAWEIYSPMVIGYFRRFLGLGQDRHDLCQEVFLRLFRRIGELREPAALRAFIVSICLGIARNEHRRQRVRRWMHLTSSGDLPDVAAASLDPEAREATSQLYAVLSRVSAEDCSLFITRYVDEMEIADIALVHGLSFGTAKRRLARATRRISARLEREPALSGYLGRLGRHGR
jgi:RNA polymerase sigma-70 factor (ECF subfamily)